VYDQLLGRTKQAQVITEAINDKQSTSGSV